MSGRIELERIGADNTSHFRNIVMNFRLPLKACLLLVLIAFLCANEALARKWTDSTGKFSVELTLSNSLTVKLR